MKKYFILLFLGFCTTVSFAQVSWNAKVGMNVSNWTGDNDGKAKIGFKAGLGIDYAFSDMWSLQPTLFFSTKGVKADTYRVNNTSVSATINQMYLELPVMAAAKLKVTDNTNIVVTAGPYLAYGIGGKIKAKVKEGGVKVTAEENTFGDGKLDRFDAGLGFGVAGEFSRIIAGIDCQFGLVKLGDGSDAPKNMNFSITLGYKF